MRLHIKIYQITFFDNLLEKHSNFLNEYLARDTRYS